MRKRNNLSMLLYLFAGLLLMTAANSCEKEESFFDKPMQVHSATHIPLSDAVEMATQILMQIDGTRTNRLVSDVTIIQDITRSGEGTVPFYLINYENENGFALMSSDLRLPQVIAFDSEGSLHLEDTVGNPVLRDYINSLTAIDLPYIPGDSLSLDLDEFPYKLGKMYLTVKPLLNETARNWHQLYPYNIYCPIINNKQCPVGCAALATAQILSYFEFPKKVAVSDNDSITLNWSSINSGNNTKSLAELMKALGSHYIKINYGSEESTCYDKEAIFNTFYKLGFTYVNSIDPSIEYIKTQLRKRHVPVLCHSNSVKGLGHIWVADGYCNYTQQWGYTVDSLRERKTYIHMVWGFYNDISNSTGIRTSKGNGYYLILDNDTIDSVPTYRDRIDKIDNLNFKKLPGLFILKGIIGGFKIPE